jgi:hypothetical protein
MTSRPDREREETVSAASSLAVPGWTLTTLIGFLTSALIAESSQVLSDFGGTIKRLVPRASLPGGAQPADVGGLRRA